MNRFRSAQGFMFPANLVARGAGLLLALAATAAVRAEVVPVPAVARAEASTAYRVTADDRPVFTEKYKGDHCAWFSFSGKASVSVEATSPITQFTISPRSAGIEARAEGSTLRFQLDRPRYLVITVNGGERLFLFADAIDKDAPKPGQAGVVNVLEFGVDPTGARIETARLQQAIDKVATQHGTLYFPPGTYLTGTLSLKSNLTVHLAGGALLLGSTRPEDYPEDAGDDSSRPAFDPVTWKTPEGVDVVGSRTMAYRRLILVDGAHNVRVTGRGIIDGRGRLARTVTCRPMLVHVRLSSQVFFDGVMLRDPAMFNSHFLASDHVTYRNVKLVNDTDVPNTDGFDPDSSQDILAENCFFLGSDDSIAIKSSRQGGHLRDVARITIRGCLFITRTSAMKLGTESHAAFHRDITFEDNDVVEADRVFNLSCMDGARYENIRFVNIRVERIVAKTPHSRIFSARVRPRTPSSRVGSMGNILIKDFFIAQEIPAPSLLHGFDEKSMINGVRIENYNIAGRVRLDTKDAGIETNAYVKGVTFAK